MMKQDAFYKAIAKELNTTPEKGRLALQKMGQVKTFCPNNSKVCKATRKGGEVCHRTCEGVRHD